jgi:ATP-dependent Lon protease
MDYKTTADIKVPQKLIDQVIGQSHAVEIIKKAAKQRRNVLLIGEPGCLIGDERVFLGTGAILKLENFGNNHLETIDRKVMIGSGNKTARAVVFHRYEKQPTIEIITETGKSIKGTYNHPLLTVAEKSGFGGGPQKRAWKRLDQIKEGDRVAVVSGVRCTIEHYLNTGFSKAERSKYGPKYHGTLPEKVTPSLAALFGYIIGDGWADSKRERLGFVVAENEIEILKPLISFVTENFGIEPPITKRLPKDRNVTLYYADISNKDVYKNLKFLGIKRVPDLVLQSGNEVSASFLKWLFTADGTVFNNGRGRRGVALKSVSLELLRDVQIMLLRFGIRSRILNWNSANVNEAPQLVIRSGYDIIKFHKKIGFSSKKKIQILDSLAAEAPSFARTLKQRSEKIVKVVRGAPEDVFDIEVPEKHRFIANGIISHNTGKTMLAQAMAELMGVADLEDILVYRNNNDENTPMVKAVKTYPNGLPTDNSDGQGRIILQKERAKNRMSMGKGSSWIGPIVMALVIILFALTLTGIISGYNQIVVAGLILGIMIFGSVLMFTGTLTKRVGLPGMNDTNEPKLIVDNTGGKHAPYIDATSAKAGALLGDVRHDPLQSGGLGTPAHLRVESGAIHKANDGVLFIDEVSSLEPKAQQELLTAMQEKKYPITGQSEMSSGALVKTEPVPCDFTLVAAGNLQDTQRMHPALRSRIRGYGYEVYMDSSIEDNAANRKDLARFVAQEVQKDKKIPQFDADAITAIIEEARRRSGRKGKLTLILRDLGGLIRAAGDLAVERGKKITTKQDVYDALALARPIEAQVISQQIEFRKDYKVFETKGYSVGKVNGLAVVGTNPVLSAGIVIPIVAEVTNAGSRAEGKFIPTGKLGKIANEAVKNVSAVIKKHLGKDTASFDMHVQFLQTYEGIEGDSASISVAISIISAMEGIPVDQSVAMTGSLSVRGAVLPVGGVTNKVEAAISAGIKKVILPEGNYKDVYLAKDKLNKIKLIPVKTLGDVMKHSMKQSKKRDDIIKELKKHE